MGRKTGSGVVAVVAGLGQSYTGLWSGLEAQLQAVRAGAVKLQLSSCMVQCMHAERQKGSRCDTK